MLKNNVTCFFYKHHFKKMQNNNRKYQKGFKRKINILYERLAE